MSNPGDTAIMEKNEMPNLSIIKQSRLLDISANIADEVFPTCSLTIKSFNKRLASLATAVTSNQINAVLDGAYAQGIIGRKDEQYSKESANLHAKDLLDLSDALKRKEFFHDVLLRKRKEKLTSDAPEGFTASDMALCRIVLLAHAAMQQELGGLCPYDIAYYSSEDETRDAHHKSKRRCVHVVNSKLKEYKKAEITDKYSFLQQLRVTPKVKDHPQQYAIDMLPTITDRSRLDILNFARNYIRSCSRKGRHIRRARQLLMIAEL